MQKRISNPRIKSEIDGLSVHDHHLNKQAMHIAAAVVPFKWRGKDCSLTIQHDFHKVLGYTTQAILEVDGQRMGGGGNDNWDKYVQANFGLGFMANKYVLELPRPFLKLIEERLELLSKPTYTEATIVEAV